MRLWFLLAVVCFAGLLNSAEAQGYLKITMIPPSDSSATDGSVNYEMVGVTQAVRYQTYFLGNDSMVGTGNNLHNLGTGFYVVLGAVSGHAITPEFILSNPQQALGACAATNDIVGEFTMGANYLDTLDTNTVIAPIVIRNPSSAGACDGQLIFDGRDSFPNGVNGHYSASFIQISPVTSDTNSAYATWTLINNTSQTDTIGGSVYDSIGLLCEGRNVLQLADLGPGVPFSGFTFFLGSEFSAFPGFSCTASSAPVSDTGQCNGSISLRVFGGSAPYTWFVDSVPQSLPMFGNQCQGLHRYFVMDSAGLSTLPQNIVVGNLQSYYSIPDTFVNQPVLDTLTYNLQNCNYNYNISVDSVVLDSVVQLLPPYQEIAYFDVWQQGQRIFLADTLVFDSIGVNQVNVTMYCDTTHRSVQGTLTIICYVDNGTYHPQPTGISVVSAGNVQFEIFPNPADDISTVHVQLPGAKKFELTVTDLSGQVIQRLGNLANNQVQLNLKNLAAGVYVVTLRSDEVVESKQLVKF